MELDLRKALKLHYLTIEDFAKRLNVGRQTVYFYFKQGDKNPLSQLEKFADVIGISVSELIEECSDTPSTDFPCVLKATIPCPKCGTSLTVSISETNK